MTLNNTSDAHKIAQELRDLSDRVSDVEQSRRGGEMAQATKNVNDEVRHTDQVGVKTSGEATFTWVASAPSGRDIEQPTEQIESDRPPEPSSRWGAKEWVEQPPEEGEILGFGHNFGYHFGLGSNE